MAEKTAPTDAKYFLGFDGGGTKTECVLADANGHVIARSTGGPSNPVRTGHARAWFSLSDAADAVLKHEKITSRHIRGVCAGLGGTSRSGVARRVKTFFERGFPNADVNVITDLELALEAAFGSAEGMILVIGTGSAAFGRDASGKTARAGGRGPWISDEGSAFDIGRRAVQAVVLAEIVDLDNIEVAQAGDQSRLLLKAHGEIGLCAQIGKNLDRHWPPQVTIKAAIDIRHSAGAEQRLNFIVAQLCADQMCRADHR